MVGNYPMGAVTVFGANFNDTARVFIDGQPVFSTTLVDSTTLQADIVSDLGTVAGTYQFTVVQTNGMSNAVSLTVYSPQQGPFVMNAVPGYFAGNESNPSVIAAADVNGDGFADVLIAGLSQPGITLLTGNPDGSLSLPQVIPTAQTYALVVGDVDGDGNPDIVSISEQPSVAATTLLGDGRGNFQQGPTSLPINGDFPASATLVDLDGDGKKDLIFYVQQSNGLTHGLVWMKNTGGGNFATPVTLAQSPRLFQQFFVADFNVDGKPDIFYLEVTINSGNGILHIVSNQGNGQFNDTVVPGFTGINILAATVVDFNLDGIPDLTIEGAQTTLALYSFLGNGNGTFTQVASMPVAQLHTFVSGDFDNDGYPDLVATGGLDPSEMTYMFGDGHGNFTRLDVVGPAGQWIAVGDINGDGMPDVAIPDSQNFVSVSLGRKDRSFPNALALTPAAAANVVLRDIDGDGVPDIFVGGISYPPPGQQGTIFLNQGKGAFQFNQNTDSTSFSVADLTGDGRCDLIGYNGNNFVIWPNTGGANFSPTSITIPVQVPGVIHVADMDGDGIPDIVTRGLILFGNGAYQFSAVTMPTTAYNNFVVGDFNGDGLLDVATEIGVFINTGHRTFKQVVLTVPVTFSIVGDFNGDGKDDLVVADQSGTITIALSRGDGTFYAGTTLTAGQLIGGLVAGDFDGDGRLDLAVGLAGSNQVAMFFNQGNGQFTRSFFASGADTYAMRGADLNGDGKIDLVFTSFPLDVYPPNVDVIFHK